LTIEEFLQKTPNPKAVVSYPIREVHRGKKGTTVLGLPPDVLDASTKNEIVFPIQVVRRPGLGDKVFGLAACHALFKQNPKADVTFSGLDSDTWLKQIPWVKTGINPKCKTVINLDNVRNNGGDRTQIMGEALGVEVEDIRFPIDIPKWSIDLHLPKKYYVFAPFAARNGPRSLPMPAALEVLQSSPVPLVFTDSVRYNLPLSSNVYNGSGLSMLDTLALLDGCSGVVGCDSGLVWLASAMGRPALVFGSHVSRLERTMTCRDMWWVETPVACGPCGDHVGTRPQCRWRERVPACLQHVTAEFVRYAMIEFHRMVG
jgi:hypothetical protein